MGLEIIIRSQHPCPDQLLLQDLDKSQQIFRLTVSYVVNLIGRNRQSILPHLFLWGFPDDPYKAFNNIIYIGKITLAVPVVKNLDLFSPEQLVSKSKVRHVRTAPGTIDRKKTQTRGRDIV